MDTLKASDKRNHFDKTRREMAEKYEPRRRLYKALSRDTQLPADIREKSKTKLADLPRNSSLTRVLNRCVFTGRTRGVYQMFRMSRIAFREMARKGILHGVKKASW